MQIHKMTISLLLVLAAVARPHCAQQRQQNDSSLATYLARHPWDPAKHGPMLVVDPESTGPVSGAGGFAAFDRKEFNVGSITAIAPTEMVFIDASFKEQPNLYDGLPRTDKV